MDRNVWKVIVWAVGQHAERRGGRFTFTDADIVLVFFWAVFHDRPVSWACRREHWPIWEHRRRLPWPSTMTRRLRTESVLALMKACETLAYRVLGADDVIFAIDGKPLVIGAASGDPDAGYGRAVRGMGKGYKLHAIIGESEAIWSWEVHPINVDERAVAQRLIRRSAIHDVLLGDRNYDAHTLYEIAGRRAVQLLTHRRYASACDLGHRPQSRWRLRSVFAIEENQQDGPRRLLERRGFIERAFGNLVSVGHGLGHLPAWARRIHRVRRWVQAKLIIHMLAKLELKAA
jgi:Transposase DDE domain